MATKKYSTSPLARLRVAANLTQDEAAAKLGYRWKQHLSHIECGRVMASGTIMVKMVEVYGVTQRRVLSAATSTWDTGVMMRRHQGRKNRLKSSRPLADK